MSSPADALDALARVPLPAGTEALPGQRWGPGPPDRTGDGHRRDRGGDARAALRRARGGRPGHRTHPGVRADRGCWETEGLAPYVSVETLADAGRFHHLCVTDRFPLAPPLLETGMMLPSCLAAEQQAAVVAMAEQALARAGLPAWPAHTELMLTVGGPKGDRGERPGRRCRPVPASDRGSVRRGDPDRPVGRRPDPRICRPSPAGSRSSSPRSIELARRSSRWRASPKRERSLAYGR